MKPINITKYKPYEYIQISRDMVLNSLIADKSVFNNTHTIRKSDAIRQGLAVKRDHAVVVFGEIEWIVINTASRARA